VGVLSSPTLNIGNANLSAPTTVTAAGLVSLGDINLNGQRHQTSDADYLVPVPSPGTITTKLILSGDTLLRVCQRQLHQHRQHWQPCRSPATPGWRMPVTRTSSGALRPAGQQRPAILSCNSGRGGAPAITTNPGVDFGNAGTFNIDTTILAS